MSHGDQLNLTIIIVIHILTTSCHPERWRRLGKELFREMTNRRWTLGDMAFESGDFHVEYLDFVVFEEGVT